MFYALEKDFLYGIRSCLSGKAQKKIEDLLIGLDLRVEEQGDSLFRHPKLLLSLRDSYLSSLYRFMELGVLGANELCVLYVLAVCVKEDCGFLRRLPLVLAACQFPDCLGTRS